MKLPLMKATITHNHTGIMTTNPSATFSDHRLQRRMPSEITGATFPALYLVRSYWLARVLARVTFFLLFVGLIALIFVPWQQTSRGTGFVVARDPQERLQPVVAMYDGVVDWIKEGFQEGSYVFEGEEVIRLKPFADDEIDRQNSKLNELLNKRSALEIALENAKLNVTLQKVSGESELKAAKDDIQATEAKYEQTLRVIEENEALFAEKLYKFNGDKELFPLGLKSALELQQSQSDALQAEQKLARFKATSLHEQATRSRYQEQRD
jgi:hypothetical protein